jgi:phenylacetate-CoA ligase
VTILDPEIEARPWSEQTAADDARYRVQLAYLFERSPFYQDKLAAAGFDGPEAAGGLDQIAELPFTDKHELRATCTPENRTRSCGSTPPAARPARRATSR